MQSGTKETNCRKETSVIQGRRGNMYSISRYTVTGHKSGAFATLLKFYFVNSLVGCIFDTNDNISHFTEKWGHVCLLLGGLVLFFFLINKTHCVSGTVAARHLFHTSKYVILIIKNHLLSVCTIEPGQPLSRLFTSSVCLVRCCSWALLQERLQQTTVRPPGHQWTGTNHQSEWLLMELEQLPQTIKKGQKNINSDVLKGGVGGGAADAGLFISTKL